MNQAEFNAHLKNSNFFTDAMGTHREATAAIVSAFIRHLNSSGKLDITDTLDLLRHLGEGTGRPSLDGERRVIIQAMRDHLQR